ncbi:MAG: thiazole synthase [Kiritimatiellae bacterium]|jgi:thiazole synthase|nr:thiazole synthase [Kiritimatiellia bacterium]
MKSLTIAGRTFNSRLFIGTGKFGSHDIMRQAIESSGSELVTVALRRVDLDKEPENDPLISKLDQDKIVIVPNTSGARTAEEAVRIARLARAAGGFDWIKLELTPNLHHLLPDPIETLKATEILVKEGFIVMPYMNADPVLAKRLEEAGAAVVMPLAAPIGTNLGLRNKDMIQIIIDNSQVPVVVDAGLGMPSHVAEAIEMGADFVLINTAIAAAANPVKMANAFAKAIAAAEEAMEAGPRAPQSAASASSPLTGFLWSK